MKNQNQKIGSKLVIDLETIIEAAEEGYRNCESDADAGVEGAANTMKRYGDAFESYDVIRRAANSHEALLKALKNMRQDWLTAFDADVNEGDKDAAKILAEADEAIAQAEAR